MQLDWTSRRSSPTNAVVAYAACNGLRYEVHREAARQFRARVFRIGNPRELGGNGFNRIGDAKAWCQNYDDTRVKVADAAAKRPAPVKSRSSRRTVNVG